jgi:hypothetical protein
MAIRKFQPLPGESILFHTTPNRKWYVITWKIGSGVLGIIILSFILFSVFAGSTQRAFSPFLPPWAASLLTNSLYLALLPLLLTAWVVEDVAGTFIGDLILTNQRIWVVGSPYAWNQNEIPLEDVASLTWRRDALFLKLKSSRKIQVHMFPDGKHLVQAYQQSLGNIKTT